MAIFVTGDTHGIKEESYGSGLVRFHGIDGYMTRLNALSFPEQKDLTKNDYVIICGDFGGIWSNVVTEEEEKALNWLDKRPFTKILAESPLF